ncbi:tRNA methyltransferase ppm2 [Coniothyrium glycines]
MASMVAQPDKAARQGTGRPKTNQKSKREKRDVDIMNTNDSSIVSKRSVCKIYMSKEPDYYEPFVPKLVRRNPLINRGYWLRMHAIEQVVHQFLKEDDGKQKVVVNLGCGYDPLPFQFWHRHASLSKQAVFMDVDYPQLMQRKRERLFVDPLLRDALLKTNLRPAELPMYVRSDRYIALGCDLKDLKTLENVLKTEFDLQDTSFLFIAEVSVTYMPVTEADALIRWCSTLPHARFGLLEQYLPQGPEHPFARTMLSHFDKLQTSIKAVKFYPSLPQQSSRFLDAGWPTLLIARNLWDLWSDDTFTPAALRHGLDSVEPFDEWEEFALFGTHYFLILASTTKQEIANETSPKQATASSDRMQTPHTEAITLSSWKESTGAALTPRRFTAAFAPDSNVVAVHGGQGVQARLSDLDILEREDSVQFSDSLPLARMCHTITSMRNGEAMLVGGRGSPTQALADCWLVKQGTWTKTNDLAIPRYRHSAVAVTVDIKGSVVEGVLAFGGRSTDGMALGDCILWTANNGWQSIPVDGPRPSPRFSAAMSTMGSSQSRGLLIGGIGADGTVVQDLWEFDLRHTPTLHLNFEERTNGIQSNKKSSAYARVGASLVPWGDSLLLIGGISGKELHSLADDFLLITPSDSSVVVVNPVVHLPTAWPLLVGMGTVAVAPNEIIIAGGGAVCFSMGSFWNGGYLTVTSTGTQGARRWRVGSRQICGTAKPTPIETKLKFRQKIKKNNGTVVRTKEVPRIRVESSDEFDKLARRGRPAIITGLDLGECSNVWTLDYLKEKIGAQRELVVHECASGRMTFKDKNFQYVKRTVAEFLDGISQGSHAYLRAISTSQPNKLPTKLEEDFPGIADDFRLPEIFETVKAGYHSSPLRISGRVSLWLHYDVLANILCQVRGTKTLRLYPPSDVKYLDYPPGGSSSNVDVMTSKDAKMRYTHPHIASLNAGDVLFIPPMWSHTATPEDDVSVAVNVFWRDLEKGYAAGKDVYGNRDLQAYENGRRDVEKIIRAFRDVPADVAGFYLERLAMEIHDKADKLTVAKDASEYA